MNTEALPKLSGSYKKKVAIAKVASYIQQYLVIVRES